MPEFAMLLLRTATVKYFVGFAIKNTPVTDVVISQTTCQDLSHPPQSESVTNISSVLNGIPSRAIAEFIKHIGFDKCSTVADCIIHCSAPRMVLKGNEGGGVPPTEQPLGLTCDDSAEGGRLTKVKLGGWL